MASLAIFRPLSFLASSFWHSSRQRSCLPVKETQLKSRPKPRMSLPTSSPSSGTSVRHTSRKRRHSFAVRENSDNQTSPPGKKLRQQEADDATDSSRSSIAPIQLPQSSPRHTTSPKPPPVTWEDHNPGVNEYMSGGVGTFSPPNLNQRIHPSSIDKHHYDTTVGPMDIETAVKTMPFKILSNKDLRNLDLFELGLPSDIDHENLKTTILGLHRALDDTYQFMGEDENDHEDTLSWDEILLGAIARRMGKFGGDKKVEYVEDMISCVGEDDEAFDDEYWAMVWSKGTDWVEMDGGDQEGG